jgi:hypothetical protein
MKSLTDFPWASGGSCTYFNATAKCFKPHSPAAHMKKAIRYSSLLLWLHIAANIGLAVWAFMYASRFRPEKAKSPETAVVMKEFVQTIVPAWSFGNAFASGSVLFLLKSKIRQPGRGR